MGSEKESFRREGLQRPRSSKNGSPFVVYSWEDDGLHVNYCSFFVRFNDLQGISGLRQDTKGGGLCHVHSSGWSFDAFFFFVETRSNYPQFAKPAPAGPSLPFLPRKSPRMTWRTSFLFSFWIVSDWEKEEEQPSRREGSVEHAPCVGSVCSPAAAICKAWADHSWEKKELRRTTGIVDTQKLM